MNDAPIKVADGRRAWQPQNSSGKFNGPISLRRALAKSLNLVTVRLAMDLGMDRVGEYAKAFGVYEKVPDALSYSLGAGETTLYKVVAAYGMFANGGKRVKPTVVDRVQDRHGNTLFRHDLRYCQGCDAGRFGKNRTPILFDARSQIMNPNTAYQLIQMMRGVVEGGTASRTVGGLPFQVAGKTGTTNDNKDAWFVGFSRNLVAGCFIGMTRPATWGVGHTVAHFVDLCSANSCWPPTRAIIQGISGHPKNHSVRLPSRSTLKQASVCLTMPKGRTFW